MIWAGTGMSSGRDPEDAAKDAASAAMSRAGLQRAGLVFVFATTEYAGSYDSMLETIRKVTGSGNLVGCSGAGVLTGDGEIEGDRGLAVMVLAADRATAAPFLVQNLKGRDRAAGREVGRLVQPYMTGGSLLALFPDTLSCDPESLFQGVSEVLGPVPLVGGGAADSGAGEKTYQMCGGRTATNSVAGVLLSGELTCSMGVTHSCRPVGAAMTVTSCQGNVIAELDGRPALEALSEAVGSRLMGDLDRLAGFIFMGFSLRDARPGETLERGGYIVRNIIGIDADSGAVAVGRRVHAGEVVSFVLRDPVGAREDLKAMLDEEALVGTMSVPRLGLYFNCCARGASLYGMPGIDTAFIRNTFESLPMAGFFGYCEFATMAGQPRLHNYSGVMTLISEESEKDRTEVPQ